ncbi:hypothetical protein DWX94_10525 [Coprococcus eutactus]|uniref:Fibronectin type-III domain-containing protein n=1 Tax=Coprococcus eutactus TaxID=33043 RepID=A0A3R5ZN32_9FIRM|nr:hypothetical protein DWX94_10525 [Coprococcus eutactus]
MRKKRKSYIAVTGSIKPEWLRGLSRKICIGALAFSAAVVLLTGGKVGAYASDQTRVSSDESQVTVGYDDLDDTLQKGGLGVAVEQQDGAASLASTYDATALEKRIVEGIKAWQTSIDVSELGLTRDDIDNGAVKSIINSHPEFISLSGGYTYWTSGSSITKIQFTYLTNAKEEQQELDAALQEVKSKIDTSGMSDEEIVLAYHEYLTSTVAYAYEDYFNGTIAANHGYDMYGALVKHSCVCQGYAETMFYLLREAGLSCAIASSGNINHAWNIVKIHGKWYHIDATWDDPVWDMPGRSYHDYFLVSFDTMNKNTLINHTKDRTDMVVSAQWGDTYTTAVDTTYESGKFWNGIEKAIFYKDGYWYSISEGSSKTSFNINKYQYSTNINKVLYSGTAKWTTPSGGYYHGVYSSIYLRGDNLYFTTPDSLNKIDITSTNVNPTELINIRTQYNSSTGNNLYAFGEQYGKLVYFITDSPNIKKTKDSSNSSKYNKEYAEYTFEMCISHKWDAGVVTKEPTYTSTGTKKYTCTNCGETKTETIAKLVCTSHVWDAGVVTKKPTYTSTGTKKYTCTNCGTTKTETIAKLECTEHKWNSGVVTKKPTYTSTGEKKYTCTNCGTTKTETIAKLVCTSHVWNSGVVTKKPTYTSTGTKKYTCTNCGETKIETIAKLVCTSHVWDSGVVTKKPTYTSTGTKKYTCTNCGETKTETIAKLVCTSHVWDSGVVTKAPTYTSAGTKEYTCVNCGTTKTSSIAMLKLSKVTVKTAVSSTGIKISWTSEKNASGYYIYRKSGKGQYALLKKVTGANTLAFDDTKVTSGVIYTYKVQAYKGTVVGAGTEASRCFVGTAKAKTANESTGIKLSWNKVGGARSYKIYKRIGTGKYTCIKTASSTTFTYLDKAVKAGTIYTYAVKPYIGSTAGTYVASKYVCLRPVTAKVSATRNGVTVRWTKTAGATSYRVYRKTAGGKYALVKKIGGANALSWTDTNTAKGKTYYYYVRAFKGNYYSAASKAVNVKR